MTVTPEFLRYLTSSTDGDSMEWLCDSRVHGWLMEDMFRGTWRDRPKDVSVQKPCDGSCQSEQRRVDLREMIAKMCEERLVSPVTRSSREDLAVHGGLPSHVHIDGQLRERLRTDAPIIGVKFDSSYTKRSGESMTLCLGDVHVKVDTSFDWLACRDNGVFETHKFRTTPCDGSCKPHPVALSRRLRKQWRQGSMRVAPTAA